MTVCSSALRKKRKISSKVKLQGLETHDEFLNRITKTLYYGKIPLTDGLSLPVTELAAELFSEVKKECSLDRLHVDEAAEISRNTCVSPCSLVLALLYLERLKTCNSEYVEKVAPSDLFLVSMMVASKFLNDDGEEDEVFNDEWATSGGLDLKYMNRLEKEFLNAINWEVYVSEETFRARLHTIEAVLALREGKRRGWFSYTELTHLVHSVELLSLAHTIITMSAVCLTSYTASVLAMVGSTVIINQIPGIASTIATSALTSASPLLMPTPLPFASPETCLTTNETVLEEIPNLDWSLQQWNEQSIDSHFFLQEENDTLTDLKSFNSKRKVEWSEQKDWLTTITQLVQLASTNTHPGMTMSGNVLLY